MNNRNITIYDVFELNRVMRILLSQQSSYNIQTSFKIHSLIKWLNETEGFVFDRIHTVFDDDTIDIENPLHQALFSSTVPFVETTLTTSELLQTDDEVKLDVNDVEILEKMLDKTED